MSLIQFLSQEEIRNKILNKWKEHIPNIAVNIDSQVYMDADAVAETLFAIQVQAFSLAEEAFIAYATGDRLSNLGLEKGFPRREATQATGEVTFSRAVKDSTDYPISLGTEVSTQPDTEGSTINFKTTEAVTLIGTILDPVISSVTTSTSGGALADSTEYFYKIVAFDALDQPTDASAEDSVTTGGAGAAHSNTITWGAVTGASKYKVYVSLATGTETYLAETTSPTYLHTSGTGDGINSPSSSNDTGATEVDAEVASVEYTGDANVAIGTITKFVDEPAGIEEVNNAAATEGGADEEDDDTYRDRLQTAFIYQTVQSKTTAAGYEQTALAVSGVATASYYNPNSGANRNLGYLYITSSETDSGLPSATLISTVQDEIDSSSNRSPNDYITVASPTAVAMNISATILQYDTSYDPSVIEGAVEENILLYLNGLGVGEDVLVVDIANAVHDTSGVVDFSVTLPAANTSVSAYEKAIPGTITITII